MGDEPKRYIPVKVTRNETKPVRVTLQKVDEPPTRVEHRKPGRQVSDILRENEERARKKQVCLPLTEEEYQKLVETAKKERKVLTDEEVRVRFGTRELELKPDRRAAKNSRASDSRPGRLRLIPGGLIGLNGPIND